MRRPATRRKPVTQALWLSAGELSIEYQRAGVGEQVLSAEGEFEPHGLGTELAEGGLPNPHSRPSRKRSSTRACAMVDLERREIIAALVGDEALEAMAVVVGERQVARRGEDARGDRRGGCHAAQSGESSTRSVRSQTGPPSRSELS